MAIHETVKCGLVQIPEGRRLFPNLTVLSNLKLGAYLRKDKDGIRKDMDEVFEHFPRLKERRSQKAGTLSGGEQQMLAIGRAMMVDTRGLTKVQAADRAIEEMERLRNDVGITDILLKQFKFADKDVEHMVKWALNDLSYEGNPRDMTGDDIRKIMKAMM